MDAEVKQMKALVGRSISLKQYGIGEITSVEVGLKGSSEFIVQVFIDGDEFVFRDNVNTCSELLTNLGQGGHYLLPAEIPVGNASHIPDAVNSFYDIVGWRVVSKLGDEPQTITRINKPSERPNNIYLVPVHCGEGLGEMVIHLFAQDFAHLKHELERYVLQLLPPAPVTYDNPELPQHPILKSSNPKDRIGVTKLPLHLLPLTAQAQQALAHLDGALKYGEFNWREEGVDSSVYVAAAMRHIHKWNHGEELDGDSGVHHLGHAMACLAIIIDSQFVDNLVDTRNCNLDMATMIDAMQDEVKRLIDLRRPEALDQKAPV